MSTETKERQPAPLDPMGNEVCLLFLKYGKCRYKKKCKKSHVLPDKNAPIMEKFADVVVEHPAVKAGPRITFSVKKTMPYARPGPPSTTKSFVQNMRRISDRARGEDLQKGSDAIDTSDTKLKGVQVKDQSAADAGVVTSSNTTAATAAVDHETTEAKPAPLQSKKKKTKRPAKVPSKCLLASLFKTTTPAADVSAAYRRPSSPPTNSVSTLRSQGSRTESKNKIRHLKQKSKSALKSKSSASTPIVPATSHYSTNESGASDEKIEQWYITNKAHMEHVSGSNETPRRLMVLAKPTTVRQKAQLKAMRKHYWECRTEIEQNLKHNIPASFALKIVRSRIDWERVAPYITLMIQAAFDMDIDYKNLPIIGTTLCALLEHRNLGGIACEKLLISWGLNDIDARRFTSHLWEVLVAAAGEATVRGGRGVGLREYHRSRHISRTEFVLLDLICGRHRKRAIIFPSKTRLLVSWNFDLAKIFWKYLDLRYCPQEYAFFSCQQHRQRHRADLSTRRYAMAYWCDFRGICSTQLIVNTGNIHQESGNYFKNYRQKAMVMTVEDTWRIRGAFLGTLRNDAFEPKTFNERGYAPRGSIQMASFRIQIAS
ncbi:hypothetical protein EDD11_007927 [Mortierella claussenii]|nr:hypothetical protein EDD11_007927 [Mortierella claussenii]